MTPGWVGKYFGPPWPSGVCEEGTQVDTPVGFACALCDEKMVDGDRGSFMGTTEPPYFGPVHRECSLRSVLGGIGHIQNHLVWCVEKRDPDAGFPYRKSSQLVWDWVQEHGFPTREEP
jgi:hypothetical protein